ncbi:MAG TPA: cytochrome c oxidase subunit II [Acidimicrobiales bacterium]|nr:cytochrome c oxidase subunit II [Acidimicrobiales bacterium]
MSDETEATVPGAGGPPAEAATGGGATGSSSAASSHTHEPHHWWRLIAIWLVLSVVLDILFLVFVGPHVPPGRMSSTAGGAVFDFNVLIVMALPVLLAVWIYMVYAIVMWRASKGGPEPVGGEQARSNMAISTAWIAITTVVVLFLAGFGTYELVQPEGAGGGQGPAPIWTPTSHTVLPIQVIGQQWKFTYRYPTFGGFETNELVLPVGTTVAFHVTSLDVIHSFWAYQLGVKADANPGQDNVAFSTPQHTGVFTVRCSELCGIWHGAMFNKGAVVSPAAFFVWARTTQQRLRHNTALLPPFSFTYTPDANGADGGYYPDNVDPYSKQEQYGYKGRTSS